MFRDFGSKRLEKSINMQGRLDIRTVAFIAEALKKRGEEVRYLADIQLACIDAAAQHFLKLGDINRFKTLEDAYHYLTQEKLLNEESMGKNQSRITGRAMSIESLHIAQRERQRVIHLSSEAEDNIEKAFEETRKLNAEQAEKDRMLKNAFKTAAPVVEGGETE